MIIKNQTKTKIAVNSNLYAKYNEFHWYKIVNAGIAADKRAASTDKLNCSSLNFSRSIYRFNNFILLFSVLILFLFFSTSITSSNLSVFAAEVVHKPILSAAQLQLLERANVLAEKITNPTERLGKLFELLAFESQFADKQHAQKTIQLIQKQIAELEAGRTKDNFYELLAIEQANIGDYKRIIVTLNNLAQSIEKSQIQFDLAEKIIYEKEESKSPIPAEVIDLLNLAFAGAEVAKDAMLESLAAMQLGRVLAKAGKIDEAKKFLVHALKKSDELSEAESKNLKQSVLRILVQNKIYKEAMSEVDKTKAQETKDLFLGSVLQTLAEGGQISDAKEGLARIKTVAIRDAVAVGIGQAIAKEGPVADLVDLAKQMSSENMKEVFVQNMISFLLDNKRFDVVVAAVGRVPDHPGKRLNPIIPGDITRVRDLRRGHHNGVAGDGHDLRLDEEEIFQPLVDVRHWK
jgi:tetratricopeptide (TPR) repeat protein